MKNVLLICLMFVLFSCDNDDAKVDDPQKATTVQVQKLAQIDSLQYKVVELDDTIYLVRDDLVEYKIINYSGGFKTTLIILFILAVICIILWASFD